MKKNYFKVDVTLTIWLVIIVLLLPIDVFAKNTPDTEYMFKFTSFKNLQYEDYCAYLSGDESENLVNVSSIKFEINNSICVLNLNVDGRVYYYKGSIIAYTNDLNVTPLISGEFKGDGILNLASFRIDETKKLTLVVENIDTANILELAIQLNDNDYGIIENIAKTNFKNKNDNIADIDMFQSIKEIFANAQPAKHLQNERNKRFVSVITSQASKEFKSTNSYSGVAAVYNTTLKPFFDNLLEDGIESPDSTMKNVFKQVGWKMYKDNNCCYVLYGVQNSSDEYYSNISVLKITNEKHNDIRRLNAKIEVSYSVCLKYKPSTNTASVMYYEMGIRLNNPAMAIELVNGSTTFSDYTKTYSLEGSGSLFNLFTAISSRLGTASQIWSALTENNRFTSDSDSFDSRDAIRAIANFAKSNTYMWSSGTSIGVFGTYRDTTYSSRRIAFSYTAYTILS